MKGFRSLIFCSLPAGSHFRRLLFPGVCVVLFSGSACEYWDDLTDGGKLPPSTPIHRSVQKKTEYSRDEAISLACNKLIVQFSSVSEKPAVSCRANDLMASRVAFQLKKARAADIVLDKAAVYRIESVSSVGNIWHFRSIHIPSGKILLDEQIPLAVEAK